MAEIPTLALLPDDFQHILRLQNTNIDGRQKVPFAIRKIRGIGRRLAFVLCKTADIDVNRRAGTLSEAERTKLCTILADPLAHKVPFWFLNRKKDPVNGKSTHHYSNLLDSALRDDLERMKKMHMHRGLRHQWGVRVRGQHTKTTGRKGKTVGVSKTKGK